MMNGRLPSSRCKSLLEQGDWFQNEGHQALLCSILMQTIDESDAGALMFKGEVD